ncbi:T9SS type A sorting domain-containing protein [Gelidibacter maritimus]|uniref:T9SS type A sorting domain-containing protein n=1 Tax=Gelidibacter maritimus TaxID=2761487 RepID=A0A7W2M7E0_9FLAO|nr:T9SS type A sorting domain-containing protein [Gelidibacter maritimus]MBA6154038.1 T9SS type A sorting domain-containing protein [Gelidibacter maritimus]
MKKITLKISLLLLLSVVTYSMNAQVTYYEDFRYENTERGFTVQKVSLGGHDANQVGKRVNDIVGPQGSAGDDSNGQFDPTSRPDERIPDGRTRDQRAIAFTNTSGSADDNNQANYAIEAWALMTNQDLSTVNSPMVSFWTQQRFVFGAGATLTVWVSENYTHGDAPSTATWTNETSNIVGAIATSGVAPQTYVKGELDLSAYTGNSVTVAFKMETNDAAFEEGVMQHGTFYISDVAFGAAPQQVANGAFSALNISASGQANIFNTPSASISESNFSNTSKWANVLTDDVATPRLQNGITVPAGEGYKFEVSGAYKPIVVTEVRYILANGTSNKGEPGESKWIVQGSNDDANWDDLSAPLGMFSNNSGAGTEYPIALNTTKAYRYYRFVLASEWIPTNAYTALQQLDFTVDDSVLSVSEFEMATEAIAVYPNPTRGIINIKLPSTLKIQKVALIDVTGKEVFNQDSGLGIDVSNFSKGLYILTVQTQDGAITSKKVLIN